MGDTQATPDLSTQITDIHIAAVQDLIGRAVRQTADEVVEKILGYAPRGTATDIKVTTTPITVEADHIAKALKRATRQAQHLERAHSATRLQVQLDNAIEQRDAARDLAARLEAENARLTERLRLSPRYDPDYCCTVVPHVVGGNASAAEIRRQLLNATIRP